MTPEALLKAYGTGQREFRNINLSGQKLDGEVLSRVDLSNANLTEANLVRANLYGANLQNADLLRAKLCGTSLKNANVTQANLQNANLQFTDFSRANLAAADFSDADLRGADLSTAQLEDPQLGEANFSSALYDDFTLFPEGVDPVKLGFTKVVDTPTNSSSSTDQPANSTELNQLKRLYDASQLKCQQLEVDLRKLKTTAQNHSDQTVAQDLELERQIETNIKLREELETAKLQLQTVQHELDAFKQKKDSVSPAFPWVFTMFFLFYCYLGFLWSSRLPRPLNLNNIDYTFLVPEISIFLASWAGFLLSNSKKSFLGYVLILGAIATSSLPIVINFNKLFLSVSNFFSIVFFAILILIINIVVCSITINQRWGRSISQFKFIRTMLLLTLFGFSTGVLIYSSQNI
jgi:Pentapeptide repeats (8 copies)